MRKSTILALVVVLAVVALMGRGNIDTRPDPDQPLGRAEKPAETASESLVFRECPTHRASRDSRERKPSSDWEQSSEVLAKLVWGEARGCTKTEQAAVVWCVLNRVDTWGNEIVTTATAEDQFQGYRIENPVDPEIKSLVLDVMGRWAREQTGCDPAVGRVLPKQYLWFTGDGEHNYFRDSYRDGNRWTWDLPSPYED